MQRFSMARRGAALLGVAAIVASACSSGSASESDDSQSGTSTTEPESPPAVFPGTDWQRGDAAEAGFDPDTLEEIATEARNNDSNCLVVARHGELVAEWYWNDTDAASSQEIFSATKSVSSTLVGIAQAEGRLAVDDPASDYIPGWRGTPSAEVTIEDILSNESGRHWDLGTDYGDLVAAPDRTGFAVGLGQDAPPGATWAYNNAAIQTLDDILFEATGEDPAAYARETLLRPIGMRDSEMSADGAGNTNMFFGLQSTCEDMARFGYLFLRGGEWDGTQVVPEDWVEAATGRPSQELSANYGYLWWLNRRGPIAGPLQATTAEQAAEAPAGQMVAGAPEHMYWALGLGGQVVQVDPGSDTVVVRLGGGDLATEYGPANTARVVTEALVDARTQG